MVTDDDRKESLAGDPNGVDGGAALWMKIQVIRIQLHIKTLRWIEQQRKGIATTQTTSNHPTAAHDQPRSKGTPTSLSTSPGLGRWIKILIHLWAHSHQQRPRGPIGSREKHVATRVQCKTGGLKTWLRIWARPAETKGHTSEKQADERALCAKPYRNGIGKHPTPFLPSTKKWRKSSQANLRPIKTSKTQRNRPRLRGGEDNNRYLDRFGFVPVRYLPFPSHDRLTRWMMSVVLNGRKAKRSCVLANTLIQRRITKFVTPVYIVMISDA